MITEQQLKENKERVDAGAAWLDATNPSWYQIIDVERLDLQSVCGCVLGQLVKDVSYGDDFNSITSLCTNNSYSRDHRIVNPEKLLEDIRPLVMTQEVAISRGFQVATVWVTDSGLLRWNPSNFHFYSHYKEAVNADYWSLTELWKQKITDRLPG